MSIEIEEIIAQLKAVHRAIYRVEPGKPNLYEDRTEYLRVEALLQSAIDGLCNPTEPREKRFTVTFSLEGERFQAKSNRLNIEQVIKLLNSLCGYIATGRNSVPLFTDPKTGQLFGEMRVAWRNNDATKR